MHHPANRPPGDQFPTDVELLRARSDPIMAREVHARLLLQMNVWAEHYAQQLHIDPTDILLVIDRRLTLETVNRITVLTLWTPVAGSAEHEPRDIVASAFRQRRDQIDALRGKHGDDPDVSCLLPVARSLRFFLKNLVRTTALTVARRRSNARRRSADLADEAQAQDGAPIDSLQLRDLLDLLPTDAHRAVVCSRIEGLSQQKIAERLGLTRDQVQRLWSVAKLCISRQYPEIGARTARAVKLPPH